MPTTNLAPEHDFAVLDRPLSEAYIHYLGGCDIVLMMKEIQKLAFGLKLQISGKRSLVRYIQRYFSFLITKGSFQLLN